MKKPNLTLQTLLIPFVQQKNEAPFFQLTLTFPMATTAVRTFIKSSPKPTRNDLS